MTTTTRPITLHLAYAHGVMSLNKWHGEGKEVSATSEWVKEGFEMCLLEISWGGLKTLANDSTF